MLAVHVFVPHSPGTTGSQSSSYPLALAAHALLDRHFAPVGCPEFPSCPQQTSVEEQSVRSSQAIAIPVQVAAHVAVPKQHDSPPVQWAPDPHAMPGVPPLASTWATTQ